MLRVSPVSPVETHRLQDLRGGRWVLACFLLLGLSSAPAQEALQEIPGCSYVSATWADGDSFLVKLPDGEERVFRLYFVDCIETDVADVTGKRRLREQARYFGVEDFSMARGFGVDATRFAAETLAKPFTIHTAFSKAPGRGGKPRHYAFITSAAGHDLGELLVERGLARAFGFGRATPDGTHRDDWQAQLEDAELVAALRGRGVWQHCDPEKIVMMRREQREELRALEAIDDALVVAPPEEPVDLNTASLEELVRTGLRESLADEVIKRRPFRSLEQLDDVPGIGPVTLAKVRPYLKIVPGSNASKEKPAP